MGKQLVGNLCTNKYCEWQKAKCSMWNWLAMCFYLSASAIILCVILMLFATALSSINRQKSKKYAALVILLTFIINVAIIISIYVVSGIVFNHVNQSSYYPTPAIGWCYGLFIAAQVFLIIAFIAQIQETIRRKKETKFINEVRDDLEEMRENLELI